MNLLDLQLNKFGKFRGNSRQVQLFITGDSVLPPYENTIRAAFQSDGWNITDVVVISPVISYFRGSQITVTANVLNDFNDDTIIQNARNIMSRLLTNVSVVIVKGKSLTANQILNKDNIVGNFTEGFGVSVGVMIGLAALGLVIYKKI